MEWYDPDDIVDDESFGGVPRLIDTLKRVYFERYFPKDAAGVLARGLERVKYDHESGSRQLTTIAIEVFRDFISNMPAVVDHEWWEIVRMGAWHVFKNGRESMSAAILNVLLAILNEVDGIMKDPSDELTDKRDRILSVIDKHLTTRVTMTARIKDGLAKYLRTNIFHAGEKKERISIVTVSASSTIYATILDAFATLDVKTLDLRILESRPLYEGVSLASFIVTQFKSQFETAPPSSSSSSNDNKNNTTTTTTTTPPVRNLEITIYTDASTVMASKNVDIMLIGADRITATGGISNKIGSLPAILAAQHMSPAVKILVLTETDKIATSFEAAPEEIDPGEVVAGWRTGHVKGMEVLEPYLSTSSRNEDEDRVKVNVKNIYFEWVPLPLITAVVCEEGVLDVGTIRERSRRIEVAAHRFFGGL